MVGVQSEELKEWKAPDRVAIHYGIIGQGQERLVVLLHGLASNMTRWTEFLCQTQLREHFTLMRVDLRGHGESRFRGRVSHEQWVRDLHGIIRAEGYKEVVLIGHSLGAQVAIMFARYYPEMVKGCVLIDPVFSENLRGRQRWLYRFRRVFRWLAGLTLLGNQLGIRRKAVSIRDLFELDRQTRRFLQQNRDSSIADFYLNPFDDMKYLPAAIYFQDVYEVMRPIKGLQGIASPTLLLLSKGTNIGDVNKSVAICDLARDCEHIIFDVDHWLLTEAPDAARDAIDKWCIDYMRKGEAKRRRRDMED